jgi:amino acid transporter
MNPPQKYGLVTLTCIVIASMIGSGVFTTSGFAIAALGSAKLVLLAWLVGGVIANCGAISYAELSRRLPVSGGEYTYLSRRLHPAAGFMAGWVSLTAGFSGAIAFSAVTCAAYVGGLGLFADVPENAIAAGLIIVSGLAHAFVSRPAASLQNLIVLLKVAALLVFLGTAAALLPSHQWHWEQNSAVVSDGPLWSVFAQQVMWVSLSYTGFNAAIYIASEVRNAAVTVPRALVLGTVLVTGLYLLLNLVFVSAAPAELIAGQADVAAIAARAVGGPRLEILMRIAVVLGTGSSVAGMIMTGPRVFSKMAQDGLFPRFFAAEAGGIERTVLLQSGIALLLVFTGDLRDLLNYLSSVLALSSAITVLTLLVPVRGDLERRRPAAATLLAAVCYVGGTLLTAVLLVSRQPEDLYGALITIVTGGLLWLTVGHGCWRGSDMEQNSA